MVLFFWLTWAFFSETPVVGCAINARVRCSGCCSTCMLGRPSDPKTQTAIENLLQQIKYDSLWTWLHSSPLWTQLLLSVTNHGMQTYRIPYCSTVVCESLRNVGYRWEIIVGYKLLSSVVCREIKRGWKLILGIIPGNQSDPGSQTWDLIPSEIKCSKRKKFHFK